MAISKPGVGSAGAWASGTTIVSSSMSVTAGDILVCAGSFDPASINCTFSKTAGTGAIGSFTHRTKLTNGVHGLTVGYATVTTTGTVTITATASAAVTNGLLIIEVYRGASGVKGGTGGTGASGTTAPLTINNTYNNSWQVEAVSLIVSATVPVASTNVTAVRTTSANISGTANDMAMALGAHESATAPGNITLTMTKGSGVAYCADILELVQQWTVAAGGTAGGSQSDQVLTNLKSVGVTESGSAAKSVTTNFKSVSVGESASAAKSVTTNKTSRSVGEAGAAAARVATNVKSVSVTQSASVTLKREELSSGALVGGGATVAGVAVHNVLHTASGDLAGAGGTIAGAAARTREHATAGDLVGTGATVAGEASSATERAASGDIAGSGAELAGEAARTREHDGAGDLVGPGAELAGEADRASAGEPIVHDSSGILSGPGAIIVGSAARIAGISPVEPVGFGGGGAVASNFRAPAVTHSAAGQLSGAGAVLSGFSLVDISSRPRSMDVRDAELMMIQKAERL